MLWNGKRNHSTGFVVHVESRIFILLFTTRELDDSIQESLIFTGVIRSALEKLICPSTSVPVFFVQCLFFIYWNDETVSYNTLNTDFTYLSSFVAADIYIWLLPQCWKIWTFLCSKPQTLISALCLPLNQLKKARIWPGAYLYLRLYLMSSPNPASHICSILDGFDGLLTSHQIITQSYQGLILL